MPRSRRPVWTALLASPSLASLCVLAGLSLPACADEPAAPLPPGVLAGVLVDLHLADARADTFGPPAQRDSLRQAYRADALAQHGLDTARWNDALDAFALHPEPLLAAYDSALARLAQEPSGLPRLPPPPLLPDAPFPEAPFSPRP